MLEVALDSLILFSFKAFDKNESTASLSKLKNAFFRNAANDGRRENVKAEFKKFEGCEKKASNKLRTLRIKMVAHIDRSFLLDPTQESLTIKEILKTTNSIVDLVDLLAQLFKKIGTVESPDVSDNSLMITPTKFAELDAEEFWRVTFGHWAK